MKKAKNLKIPFHHLFCFSPLTYNPMIQNPARIPRLQNILIHSIIVILLIVSISFSGCLDAQQYPVDTKTGPGQNSQTKVTTRNFANPIADAATFHTIVQSIVTDNPFGCMDYSVGGEYHAPVEILDETYTARVLYKDPNGTFIGRNEGIYNTYEGYNAGVEAIMADNKLALAYGGIPVHNSWYDSYDATLRCHDPSGEIYYLMFSRDHYILVVHSESIRKKVESWADGIPSLKEMPAEPLDSSLR